MRIDTSSIDVGSSAMMRSARRRARARSRRAGVGRRKARAGTSPRPLSGGTSPTCSSSACTRASTCVARHDPVDAERPLEVVTDGLDRVQRTERVLEDHLHLRAIGEDVAPAPLAGDVACRRRGSCRRRVVQARKQARDRALAAAALADERGDRARAQCEADVFDRVHACSGREGRCRRGSASSGREPRAARAASRSCALLHQVAGDVVPGLDLVKQRPLGRLQRSAGSLAAAVRAARVEAAAGGGVAQVGRRACDARRAARAGR